MNLHSLQSYNRTRLTKRIGRGGKRGTTSGRGTKGQRSRAGHRIRPALRDLVIRIPKRRGFRNKSIVDKPIVIRLSSLVAKSAGRTGAIDMVALKTLRLIPAGYRGKVKVLGTADVKHAIKLKGIPVSKSVGLQIEKAGGTIEQ